MAAIKSDRGYIHSLRWYTVFMREARKMRKQSSSPDLHPLLHTASIEAMESQADTIGEQLDEYEKEVENGSFESEILKTEPPPEGQKGSMGSDPDNEKTG